MTILRNLIPTIDRYEYFLFFSYFILSLSTIIQHKLIKEKEKNCQQTRKLTKHLFAKKRVQSKKYKNSLTGGFEPPTFRLTAERSAD